VKIRDQERLQAHPFLSRSLFVESQCPLCGCQGISTAVDPGSVAMELCHLMELKGDLGRCMCVFRGIGGQQNCEVWRRGFAVAAQCNRVLRNVFTNILARRRLLPIVHPDLV